jgi:hypothetical protein
MKLPPERRRTPVSSTHIALGNDFTDMTSGSLEPKAGCGAKAIRSPTAGEAFRQSATAFIADINMIMQMPPVTAGISTREALSFRLRITVP